jgi:hypothetical protein
MEYLRIALMAFVQVFLVALQTRNCAQSRYGAGFVTSLLIGSTWLVLVHDMVANNFTWGLSLTYVIGQALGWLTGTYIHKTFFARKKHDDW